MEIFAGTGGVTASFKRSGFSNSVAVDKTKAAGALTSIVPLDLTKDEDQQAVFSWLRHPAVRGVFLAPPCGTASAARSIDIPGERPPQPLRSLDEPDGISGLSGTDLTRVSAANILYAFCAEVLELCCELDKLFMLENPRNSLFWMTTAWRESICADSLFYAEHQACAYGGKRPKWTRLAANFEHVGTICKVCPQNHQHEPWGLVKTGASKRVFATSLEVHYPTLLCDAIVHAFILCLTDRGLKFTDKPKVQHVARASTGQQSKSLRLPPLVPQFASKLVAMYAHDVQVWPVQAIASPSLKLLHEIDLGGLVSAKQLGQKSDMQQRLKAEFSVWGVSMAFEQFTALGFDFDRVKVFGMQWSPQEFLGKACAINHPLDPAIALPSVLADTVEAHARMDAHEVARSRAEFFLRWSARASQLSEAEKKLRNDMDPLVERAVRGKKILLFEEMLKHYEYPDMEVVNELKFGSPLTGDVPQTSMLPFKFTPSLLTREALGMQSALRRDQVLSDPKGSGDAEVDAEVWQQTMDEVAKNWLRGPIPLEEVPADAPISRRFGLRQKHKIRLIDDFSESSVNGTVSVFLHTVDVACAAIMHWFSCSQAAGCDSKLLARTFDLSSAYRQVGLDASGRDVAFIRVFNPEKTCWCIFQALVLPFGAVRSVHSFLRLARSIIMVDRNCGVPPFLVVVFRRLHCVLNPGSCEKL